MAHYEVRQWWYLTMRYHSAGERRVVTWSDWRHFRLSISRLLPYSVLCWPERVPGDSLKSTLDYAVQTCTLQSEENVNDCFNISTSTSTLVSVYLDQHVEIWRMKPTPGIVYGKPVYDLHSLLARQTSSVHWVNPSICCRHSLQFQAASADIYPIPLQHKIVTTTIAVSFHYSHWHNSFFLPVPDSCKHIIPLYQRRGYFICFKTCTTFTGPT